MSNPNNPQYPEMYGAPREGWSGNLIDGAVQRWTGLSQDEVKALVERSKADLDAVHWALAPIRWIKKFFVKG